MIGIADNRQEIPDTERSNLARAGHSYMQSGEYPLAYYCFKRSGRTDTPVLYNMALCCFHTGWYEECRSLLLEAERRLPPDISQDRFLHDLPATVLHWEHENSPAYCPMPPDAPSCTATVQLLRLKAEVSAKLRLYPEVRTIHARLGNKYQHIEELIKNIQP